VLKQSGGLTVVAGVQEPGDHAATSGAGRDAHAALGQALPAELAGEVLARADLRQVHGDAKQMRQARSLNSKDT
jgi:hypothetical protein